MATHGDGIANFAALHESAYGPSLPFVAVEKFGRFWSEPDIAGFEAGRIQVANDPERRRFRNGHVSG